MFEAKKMEIGKQLKARRSELNIMQSYIQDYTDIAPSTLSNIEQGKSNYTIDNFLSILEILGMEIVLKVKEA
ncbi:helix-turn-helix domain-containing protein [Sulfurimonas sp.]